MSSNLLNYLVGALGLVSATIQVTATILLMKERMGAVWMMFVGAIVGGLLALYILFGSRLLPSSENIDLLVRAVSWMGWMSFTLGLLWYSLKRRAMANRIEELEAILRAHTQQQAGARSADPC
ncbi:hypothetical protein KBB96_04730 [Luteolibacter ambystomatis]|uniref:Uncharacterized protein n=1 Tax=Luteolibacter ambystomatis TaxID=2824561 RepID=A0A975J1A5_9BACT|nr:hypothetical protein [Luteolibacter ambystomatis]QUE52198.1 hypothetical protein KBB96_04730 [Luteolibacter ambystomatis]